MNIYTKLESDAPSPPGLIEALREAIQTVFTTHAINASIAISEIPDDGQVVIIVSNGLAENIYSNIDSMVLPPISICNLDSEDTESSFLEYPERAEDLEKSQIVQNDPRFRIIN